MAPLGTAATPTVSRSARRHMAILLGLFVLTLPFVNPYIRGDGNGYYAYVRSAVIDGDLRFENEFRRGDPAFQRSMFDEAGRVLPERVGVDGHVRNHWAVGPALLWTPFFVAAHASARLIAAWGRDVVADGYAGPYRWLCAAGTAFYAFLGLLLAYDVARSLTSPAAAFPATVAIWFASSLPIYTYFVPFHVHALASFAVALFVWYWVRTAARRDARAWALWGVLGGLAVTVYQLNAVFLLIPFAELIREATADASSRRWSALGRVVGHAVSFGLAGLAALGPHFVVKWRLHGSPWSTGYAYDFFWRSPRLLETALSPEHGLLLWTPVLGLALAGLLAFRRRERWTGSQLAGVFIVYYYVVASYGSWHGQSSFGNRFFVSFTPVFVIGLAALLDVVRSRGPQVAVLAVLAVLVLWNGGLMLQWGTNLIPNRGPVDVRLVAANQVTLVPVRGLALLTRYFADRDGIVRDVEREDLAELKAYRLRR